MFRDSVHVLHCCVHVARNIIANTGQASTLIRDFWNMRYSRSSESETKFMATLNKVHNTKRSTFTTHLVNSVDSFLPSKVDPFLRRKMLPELGVFSSFDLTGPFIRCRSVERVLFIVNGIMSVDAPEADVLTLDNTNTIESYFSTVKGKLPLQTRTLVDVFNAVNYTEKRALAMHNPAQPMIPETLSTSLSFVVSREVQRVMSMTGIRCFLQKLASASRRLLRSEPPPDDNVEQVIFDAIANCVVIESFKWMPDEWVLSLEEPNVIREIKHIDSSEQPTPVNFIMRLEPFMSIANRSIGVFYLLNECLTNLYSVTGNAISQNLHPANFAFFNRVFNRFSAMSDSNKEVAHILEETWVALETMSDVQMRMDKDEKTERKSVVDPVIVRVNGQRTKATSSKVDRTANEPRTKMVDDFQMQGLKMSKKIYTATCLPSVSCRWSPCQNMQ